MNNNIDEILNRAADEFFSNFQDVPVIAQRVSVNALNVSHVPPFVEGQVLSIGEILLQDGERINEIMSLMTSETPASRLEALFKEIRETYSDTSLVVYEYILSRVDERSKLKVLNALKAILEGCVDFSQKLLDESQKESAAIEARLVESDKQHTQLLNQINRMPTAKAQPKDTQPKRLRLPCGLGFFDQENREALETALQEDRENLIQENKAKENTAVTQETLSNFGSKG